MAGVAVFDEDWANPVFKEFQLSRVRSFGRFRLSLVHRSHGSWDNTNREQRKAAKNQIETWASSHADCFPVRVGQDWAERCETWNFRLCTVGQWLEMLSGIRPVGSRT
jgi:hypothetical protein